jgi:hypothetical protein
LFENDVEMIKLAEEFMKISYLEETGQEDISLLLESLTESEKGQGLLQ